MGGGGEPVRPEGPEKFQGQRGRSTTVLTRGRKVGVRPFVRRLLAVRRRGRCTVSTVWFSTNSITLVVIRSRPRRRNAVLQAALDGGLYGGQTIVGNQPTLLGRGDQAALDPAAFQFATAD